VKINIYQFGYVREFGNIWYDFIVVLNYMDFATATFDVIQEIYHFMDIIIAVTHPVIEVNCKVGV
jgi:hypothetical protein